MGIFAKKKHKSVLKGIVFRLVNTVGVFSADDLDEHSSVAIRNVTCKFFIVQPIAVRMTLMSGITITRSVVLTVVPFVIFYCDDF